MAFILNIDTATEKGSVCLGKNEQSLICLNNEHQKEHASFIHDAVEIILSKTGMALTDIDAFAVTSGPGSYTGLRVAMATAKGFCFTLSKHLITVNTLKVMTLAARQCMEVRNEILFCPMIDARRMEVFSALYDSDLKEIVQPQPLLLDEFFLSEWSEKYKICCFGSGSKKFQAINPHINISFTEINFDATYLAILAYKCFQNNDFTDIIYSQPNYFKDFYLSK